MTATAATLWWRFLVWGLGAAALLLATPDPVRWSLGVALAVVVPLAAAIRPQGLAGWCTPLFTLGVWIVGTLNTTYPSLPLALVTGAALYAHHSASALAAAWPVDAAPTVAILRGWALRLGAVLAASAAVTIGVAAAISWPLAAPAEVFAVLGTLGALGIAGGTLLLIRRKSLT